MEPKAPIIPMEALMALVKGVKDEGDENEDEDARQTSAEDIAEEEAEEEEEVQPIESVENEGELSMLQAVVFSCILEDCIDRIKILGLIGGLPAVKTNIKYKTLEERYGSKEQQSHIFDPETLEPYEGSIKKQLLIKFQKDRSYIEQLLIEGNKSILTKLNVSTLTERLNEFYTSYEEQETLLRETKENLEKVKKLSSMVVTEKQRLCKELQEKSEYLGKLKDEYEDLVYENEIKQRYVNRWENARVAQNQEHLKQKEDYYLNILQECKNKYQWEMRINGEIEAYLTETQNEYSDGIETWMERYDKEIETKDVEIQFMKEKREVQFGRLEKLSQLYATHKQEMEDYLILREKRRQEEELLEKLNKAATKIQAWWRGTMVRRCLGPYRKKKGKKGKDKSKDKKKKK